MSAFALGPTRWDTLASYVREQGGGPIVIGGEQIVSMGWCPMPTVRPRSVLSAD